MTIVINKSLVRNLIQARFGSVDSLATEWEARFPGEKRRKGKPRDRSTIYRWIDRGIPSTEKDLLGFCGVLDVDPVAIIHMDSKLLKMSLQKERVFFLAGLRNLTPFSPLWPLYTPGPAWPDQRVANEFYGRNWNIFEFSHEAVQIANVYAEVGLRRKEDSIGCWPSVYHVAYRRQSAIDQIWRPYGTVIGYADGAMLISESGDLTDSL